MKKSITSAILLLYFISRFSFSQVFVPLGSGSAIPGVSQGHISWADFDKDGDLDFLIIGQDESYNSICKIFENKLNEDKWFVERTDFVLQGLFQGWSDWGDFDKDGDPDLVIAGSKTYSSHITAVYENKVKQGLGFVERKDICISGSTYDFFPGVYNCKVDWYDFNSDGYLDVLINGTDKNYDYIFQQWENDKTGKFFLHWYATGPDGSTGYSDYDKDGDIDMFITYYYSNDQSYWADGYAYNTSSNTFDYVGENVYLRGTNGLINFADFNGDGYEDVVVTGGTNETFTRVYTNKPLETQRFLRDNISVFKNVKNGSTDWADMDKDGDLDLLLSGETSTSYISGLIYRNDNGVFTEMSSLINLSFKDSYASWADFNGDTYPDIIVTGEGENYKKYTRLFANNYDPENKTYAFSELKGYPTDKLDYGFMAWGDIDNDTYLDFLVSGYTFDLYASESDVAMVYMNKTATNSYFDKTAFGITGLSDGSAKWFDADNDNDLDLFITGSKNYTQQHTKLYLNKIDENLGFIEYTGITFKKLDNSSIDIGDYDNDGDYDILVTGSDASSYSNTLVYENTLNVDNKFIEHTDYGLYKVSYGDARWVDLDNDGYLDVITLYNYYVGIYFNELPASKSFYHALEINFSNDGYTITCDSKLSLADYDQDGDMDFVISIYQSDKAGMYIYRNDLNNSGLILNEDAFTIPVFKKTSMFWGDYDNDGDLDIVISGDYQNNLKTILFENRLSQSYGFVEITGETIPGVKDGKLFMVDFDNDKDLDIALIGDTEDDGMVLLAKNTISVKNSPPSAPSGLRYNFYDKGILLSWNKSTDDKTKADALSYNLRIGTAQHSLLATSGKPYNIVSPQATLGSLIPGGTEPNGFRFVNEIGNAGFGTSAIIRNLPYGTYYWAVQAIDNAYAGSTFSEENTLLVKPDATFKTSKSKLCMNDTLLVEFKGYYFNPSQVTFTWNFDGAVILSGSGEGPYLLKWNTSGNKTISLTIQESGQTSAIFQQTVEIKSVPGVELGKDITACNGANVTLNPNITGSFTGLTYKWNNGQTTKSILVSQENTYKVTVTTTDNCTVTDSVKVDLVNPYSSQEICVVTVDEGKNLIAWERTGGKGIASYNIYKETTESGKYAFLANVPFSETSVYVDQSSVPGTRSERYKISVKDTCGNESELSNPHKTMHLTINVGVNGAFNLIWDKYEGINFYSYYIYRGTSSDNMTIIDSIPNNIMAYTDNPPAGKEYFYKIVVKLPKTCVPTTIKASSGPFAQAASNMEKKMKTSGIFNEEINYSPFSLLPNPSDGIVTLFFNGRNFERLDIFDINGKTVFSAYDITDKQKLDLTILPAGIYSLKVSDKNRSYSQRLVLIK